MAIEFSCPNCATHFKLSDSLAGKTGRCNKCDHRFKIPVPAPAAATAVATTGRFHLNSVNASLRAIAAVDGAAAAAAPRLTSNVSLVPITHQTLQRIARARQPEVDSGPYRIAAIPIQQPKRRGKKPPGIAKRVYKKQTSWVLWALRGISDFAYLISTPFILVLMLGVLLKRRDVAVIAATGIILPNLVRFVVNGSALLVTPFKDSPVQGVLFFIPPFTFYYLWKHWKRMKRAAWRFLSPGIPIICVVLVFAFVPWIQSGETPEGATIGDRLRSGVGELQTEIEGQLQKVQDLEPVQDLTDRAREGLDELSQDERVQDVTNRAREGVEEIQRKADELSQDERVQELKDRAQEGVESVKKAAEDGLKQVQDSDKPESSDK